MRTKIFDGKTLGQLMENVEIFAAKNSIKKEHIVSFSHSTMYMGILGTRYTGVLIYQK
jgi:hypothetical protein